MNRSNHRTGSSLKVLGGLWESSADALSLAGITAWGSAGYQLPGSE